MSNLHYFADNRSYYGHGHSLCFLKCNKVSEPSFLQTYFFTNSHTKRQMQAADAVAEWREKMEKMNQTTE